MAPNSISIATCRYDDMRILVPVEEPRGLESPVSEEFGEAPYFAVVTDGGVQILTNEEVMRGFRHRWEAIVALKPDVVITKEIGRPAYQALRSRGVRIYLADGATLKEALEKLRRGELAEFPPELVHEPRHPH
ncbi:Dinitrogenase iron-molybdenum cofactor biosynthesis [Pyrobaculum arsenaticum DSM 13514]|uniref:Dinitrogenase iron-molybdenum cofactor biosynthesis n=2 Tax=Pyrobaculum arsenaticum TaxID=121277 RepID=A4WHE0_PYRAR|nr:Dinitrogenase iron-molybdenum cofactor biosynthesis [Pyrobaculum arsenaticum DSM 13514]